MFVGQAETVADTLFSQERLLEPYTTELRGFDDFHIDGHVQPVVAEAVVAKVKEEPPIPDPNTFLEDLLNQKELGDQALRDGDQEQASKTWKDATSSLLQESKCRTWPRLKEAGGEGFTYRVSELAFQILSNQAQCSLEAMRSIPLQIQTSEGRSFFVDMQHGDKPVNLRRRMVDLARTLQSACVEAEEIGTLLGTGWTPSREQLARVCYTQAQGLRLREQDVDYAEERINLAAELQPDDPLIQSEAQQIIAWKARVGA